MSKELSVLVAAYDESDSAKHEYSVLKEELPKTGLVMDRSKMLVLATSYAPNEIGTEHTGGGPVGKVVERAAGQALKGRLAPGTAMIVGVIEPAVEHEVSERRRTREVGRSSPSSGTAGRTRRGRRPLRRPWAWPWRWPWSSGFTPLRPRRRSARSPPRTRASRTRPARGSLEADVNTDFVLVAALLILGYTLISGPIKRSPVTPAMIFVSAGVLVGPDILGVVDLHVGTGGFKALAELALTLLLFLQASRLNFQAMKDDLPRRLVFVGLPLTIAVGTVGALLIFPELSFWEAAILAIVVAPIEAALVPQLVTDRRVPGRVRRAFTIESGLSDGLGLGLLLIALALASEHNEGGLGEWLSFLGKSLGMSLAAGAVVGIVGGWLLAYRQESRMGHRGMEPALPDRPRRPQLRVRRAPGRQRVRWSVRRRPRVRRGSTEGRRAG